MFGSTRSGTRKAGGPIANLRLYWRGYLLSLTFIALVAALTWTTKSFQECVDNNQSYKSSQILDKSLFFPNVLWRWVYLRSACARATAGENDGAIAALATVVVAIFTFTLWKSTEKLWVASNKSLEITERAFVFLEGFETEITTLAELKDPDLSHIDPFYQANLHLYITRFAVLPRWRNAGNTPTRNMKVKTGWQGLGGPEPPNYSSGTHARPFFLGPSATELGDCIEIPPARDLVMLAFEPVTYKNPPKILIWGRADYEDVFGRPHFTEWCRQVRLDAHKGDRLRATFIQWGDYNRTDEDGT